MIGIRCHGNLRIGISVHLDPNLSLQLECILIFDGKFQAVRAEIHFDEIAVQRTLQWNELSELGLFASIANPGFSFVVLAQVQDLGL